jgi:transcriptional regulator with XRE-family HTH domain
MQKFEELKSLREMANWTQFDLAKESGVGRTRVSLFENGHIPLRTEEIAAIERALRRAIKLRANHFMGVISGEMTAV